MYVNLLSCAFSYSTVHYSRLSCHMLSYAHSHCNKNVHVYTPNILYQLYPSSKDSAVKSMVICKTKLNRKHHLAMYTWQ